MADNMTQYDKKFRLIEEKIIKKSQLVFFNSINLKNKIKNISKRRFLPNGVILKYLIKLNLAKNIKKRKSKNCIFRSSKRYYK